MEDKLLKILKIKIDAINKNIDNLNYLNGELEKNNASLEYIDEKISLFKDGNVLKFEEISKEDFEKILSMVKEDVSNVFNDKTCNYEGIIYIIEGIKKSISLELTSEQTNAILSFIEGMKEKHEDLLETIGNLSESKTRLPETDLNILTDNLDVYDNMVSKLENNLYLTEVDELSDAMDYAGIDISEKSNLLEYLLKYNADIYLLKEETDVVNPSIDEDLDAPIFDYDEVEVTDDIDDEDDSSLDDIKFNLDNFNLDSEVEKQNKVTVPSFATEDTQLPKIDVEIPIKNENVDLSVPDFPFDTKVENEEHELNTVELNDIIQKIDNKLKEMEAVEEEKVDLSNDETDIDSTFKEETPSFKIPDAIPEIKTGEEMPTIETYTEPVENQITIDELMNKYSLSELNISNNNLNDVDLMLKVINDNNIIDLFKNNKEIFGLLLNNYDSVSFEELCNLIKDNLVVKEKEYLNTFEILLNTMPVLFTDKKVFNAFKENINFFKEKKINLINLFDNYRELLIMNNSELVKNYDKVSAYGIEINNDNVKYFLYNRNVLEKLDYYIEAYGYEKGFLGKEEHFDGVNYIEKNPYKLNNGTRDMLLKLRYASENNIKIYGNKPGILAGEITNPKVDIINLTPEYLDAYFNGNYDFIGTGDLVTLKNELNNLNTVDMTIDDNITKLDKSYKKDELKYQFDKNIVSRIKTIRVYNYLKGKYGEKNALIIALTYNSVLLKDEYEKIVNVVNDLMGGK